MIMRRAASVNRVGSLFNNEPARQNEAAGFQLASCNSKEIWTELTTDCRVGFKMMQNSVLSYKRVSSPHVITPFDTDLLRNVMEKKLQRSWLKKIYILNVQSCNLCNNKYMIASTQITNTKIFVFIQSWTVGDKWQIHKIKQNGFFNGMFYTWFFAVFYQKSSKFDFCVDVWVLAIKFKHFRDFLKLS